jgi:glycosyltransferase involved in cell wall biosynthesis
MGRVLLEAMTAGKPRIGSNVGGIPTTIRDGEDGLLIPPEDSAALSIALERLMGNSELRARLGANGADRAKREFAVEHYFERTAEFYASLLSPAQPGHQAVE